MVNFSSANYLYEYDLFWTPKYSNLTQWQLEQILDFPEQGRQCMIDFWTSPPPQGTSVNPCCLYLHKSLEKVAIDDALPIKAVRHDMYHC